MRSLPWLRRLRLAVALLGTVALGEASPECLKSYGDLPACSSIDVESADVAIGLTPEHLRGFVDQVLAKRKLDDAMIVDLASRLGVARAVVATILSILDKGEIETSQLSQNLTEVTLRHLALQKRIAGLVTDNPGIRVLVDMARAKIDQGQYERADGLLARAENVEPLAAHEADAIDTQAYEAKKQRNLEAAAIHACRGDISLTRRRYEEAAEHFGAAAELVPVAEVQRADLFAQQRHALDKARQTEAATATNEIIAKVPANETWSWIHLGRPYFPAGNFVGSEASVSIARVTVEPAESERDLATAHSKVGEASLAGGDSLPALVAFKAASTILAKLAAQDPANRAWQRDRSDILERIGDVRVAQGDWLGALEAFQASLDIARAFAARDPSDSSWEHKVFYSHDRIGDIRVAQGDLPGALEAFQDSLDIIRRLTKKDPSNEFWQRERAVSYSKLGEIRVAQGSLARAIEDLKNSHAILEMLAAAEPADSKYQLDLAVSLQKIDKIQTVQRDLKDALVKFQANLDIREKLAIKEPRNSDQLNVVAVDHVKFDAFHVAEADLQRAREATWTNLSSAKDLVNKDSDKNEQIHTFIGDMPAALGSFRASLDIREILPDRDPGNSVLQRDLIVFHWKLADRASGMGDKKSARQHLEAARAIASRLSATGQLDPRYAFIPSMVKDRLDQLVQPVAGD